MPARGWLLALAEEEEECSVHCLVVCLVRLQACGSMISFRAAMETHGVPTKTTATVVRQDTLDKIPTTQDPVVTSVEVISVVVIREAVTLAEEGISNSLMTQFESLPISRCALAPVVR